jgi:hypothetical protein
MILQRVSLLLVAYGVAHLNHLKEITRVTEPRALGGLP